MTAACEPAKIGTSVSLDPNVRVALRRLLSATANIPRLQGQGEAHWQRHGPDVASARAVTWQKSGRDQLHKEPFAVWTMWVTSRRAISVFEKKTHARDNEEPKSPLPLAEVAVALSRRQFAARVAAKLRAAVVQVWTKWYTSESAL